MGGTLRDGLLEIAAHAHRQSGQPIARRDLRQQREMQARGFVNRGNAHQAFQGQAKRAAFGHQRVRLLDGTPGLLAFVARVHLNEDVRTLPGFPGDPRDGLRQLDSIDRMDHVEQVHRRAGLVGLQGADQVKLNALETLPEGGPLALRLLHPVLAEDTVAFVQNRLDPLQRLDFRDGDQGDVRRIAPVAGGGGVDAGLDV